MNCLICNTPLTGTNTPLFGATSSDGQKVCTKCHKTVALKLPITSIKKATAEQIRIEYEMYTDKKNNEVQSLENLKAKIREINPTASNKKEVKELLKILMNDEVIENVNTGYLKEGKGMTGNGLIVATNYRVIFIDMPTFGFGIKMEDFPYKNISSVTVSTGILKSELKIICSGNTAIIDMVRGAKEFSEFVRRKTFEIDTPQKTVSNSVVNEETNILEKIEKLAELKEKGILTEEEFNSQKSKLLEKL